MSADMKSDVGAWFCGGCLSHMRVVRLLEKLLVEQGFVNRLQTVRSPLQARAANRSHVIRSTADTDAADNFVTQVAVEGTWGVWRHVPSCSKAITAEESTADACWVVRLKLAGEEICRSFRTQDEAGTFQARSLADKLSWPRQPVEDDPVRDPTWDHPAELEPQKEYIFREAPCYRKGSALSEEQIREFNENGFLLGVPILAAGEELESARKDFDDLLASRTDRAPTDEARFRSAHTLSRPLHQDIVARLARNEKVIAVVEAILGPRFVCWSAHLFCKLPGDPTEQPWHQDAGFWPLSQSRALTVWVALDDVDASNAAVIFVEGSHRLGRIPWRRTETEKKLLTQEIPDVDLIGTRTVGALQAGQASVHCDLTVHGSTANTSTRRRAGLALRFVATDADCLGPMINGYHMNKGCILPKGVKSDPRGHWKALRRRPGGSRAPRWPQKSITSCQQRIEDVGGDFSEPRA